MSKIGKIGKTIILIVSIFIILTAVVIIFFSSTRISLLNQNNLSMSAEVGVNVLKNKIDELNNEADLLSYEFSKDSNLVEALSENDIESINSILNNSTKTSEIFSIIYNHTDGIVFKSKEIDLGNISFNLNKVDSDYYLDSKNNKLTYISTNQIDSSNFISFGVDYSMESYVDNVKQMSDAETTVFAGDTRLSTTVVAEGGKRAIGTKMSDQVKEKVIIKGEAYEARADILGNPYFTRYEPIKNKSGNIVGALFAGFLATAGDTEVTNSVLMCILIGGLICAGAMIFIFWFTAKMIVAPTMIAKELIENMSKGKLDIKVENVVLPKNEVGDMVRTLEETKNILFSYIEDIIFVMQSMAAGDFTKKPKIEYLGNFSSINDSMIAISEQLGEIVQSLIVSSSEVTSGSTEISEGSKLLAEGATRQAAAVEELSSTITEISNKITENAKNADEADHLATDTCSKVSIQSQYMNEMSEAMQEIKQKSAQIEAIIKTIDDISFQTNILSLNAAVEAARAGDVGKGFAVVADEVRNLATKSNDATNQTAEIINKTIEAVNKGFDIVTKTVESMKEVSLFTEKTNGLINKIAIASKEQATSISQVTVGISQISDVIQQNSATAEQSAASCEELSGQAELLRNQISKFKT